MLTVLIGQTTIYTLYFILLLLEMPAHGGESLKYHQSGESGYFRGATNLSKNALEFHSSRQFVTLAEMKCQYSLVTPG